MIYSRFKVVTKFSCYNLIFSLQNTILQHTQWELTLLRWSSSLGRFMLQWKNSSQCAVHCIAHVLHYTAPHCTIMSFKLQQYLFVIHHMISMICKIEFPWRGRPGRGCTLKNLKVRRGGQCGSVSTGWIWTRPNGTFTFMYLFGGEWPQWRLVASKTCSSFFAVAGGNGMWSLICNLYCVPSSKC